MNSEQNYIEDCAFICLIKPHIFCLLNIDINKIEIRNVCNIYTYLKKYGFCSELYTYFYVKNSSKNKKEIINLLNKTNNNKSIQKIYGNEYYLLNYKIMLEIIKNVIKNDIIYEMNVNKDINSNKNLKISIYYDQYFNVEIYNKIIDKIGNYENNYENRIKNFYNIYCENKYYNMTSILNNIEFSDVKTNIITLKE